MSISQRSTKAALYSEIERLRDLADSLEARNIMQAETIARREATINDLTTQLQGRAQQTAARGDRATRMLITKRLAITLCATVRWNEEYGFEYMDDGHWTVVPRHTLEFVTRDLQA